MSNLEGLSVRQRAIVRKLVDVDHVGTQWPAPFLATSTGSRILLNPHPEVEASRGDLTALDAAGLIRFEARPDGRNPTVTLLPAGRLAVESNFGMAKDRLILRTLMQLQKSGETDVISTERLAEATGLSPDDVEVYAGALSEGGLVLMTFGGYAIQGRGIVEAERTPRADPPGPFTANFHGPTQIGAVGPGAAAHGTTFGDINTGGGPSIDRLRERVAEDHARIASILESILATLDAQAKAGEAKPGDKKGLAEKGKALVDAAKSVGELGLVILKLCGDGGV